jgi:hypothetical protein
MDPRCILTPQAPITTVLALRFQPSAFQVPVFGPASSAVANDDFAEMGAPFEMAIRFNRPVERVDPMNDGSQPMQRQGPVHLLIGSRDWPQYRDRARERTARGPMRCAGNYQVLLKCLASFQRRATGCGALPRNRQWCGWKLRPQDPVHQNSSRSPCRSTLHRGRPPARHWPQAVPEHESGTTAHCRCASQYPRSSTGVSGSRVSTAKPRVVRRSPTGGRRLVKSTTCSTDRSVASSARSRRRSIARRRTAGAG